MNQMVAAPARGDIMESVIAKGDLSKLSAEERSRYYMEVCKSVGLNPLTQPLAYITLNGKLTLYATRGCTDQLRSIHKISVTEMTETEREGVIIVTAKVQNGEGRTDMAKGAVPINGLKGDALANAILKCETKAKRRATLSICGLGILDELEVETIPQQQRKSPPKNEAPKEPPQETAQEGIEEIEEQDDPTPHQVMVFDECKAYIGAATTPEDYRTRLKNNGFIEGGKTLTVFQRNALRDYCKEVEERVKG